MGLISEIRDVLKRKRGKAAPISDQIAAVNAAMARLRQEREAAEAGISAAAERRREILLEDASDDAIAELDREADRLHLQLERIDAVEPELLARLQDLQNAARRQQWQSLVYHHDEAMKAYLAAFGVLTERYADALAVWARAAAQGFNERLHRFVQLPAPHVVIPDVLYRLEREFGRVTGLSAPVSPAAVPALAQPAVAATPAAVANGHAPHATANGTVPPAPPAKKRAPRRPPAEAAAGEVAVYILRPGIELQGCQASIGDRFNLPSAEARRLVEQGAADFCD
jgi:hypothetical protein